MSTFPAITTAAFLIALTAMFLVFLGYPLLLIARNMLKNRDPRVSPDEPLPQTVSILIAARNADQLIQDKVRNSLETRFPDGDLEVVVVSDGSTDRTEELLKGNTDPRLKATHREEHRGKAEALNEGMKRCTGQIVVFTDVDAVLEQNAIESLQQRFRDPGVGGVCGQRVIGERKGSMQEAQRSYIALDSLVKILESKYGSITSNDGKLYAVRQELLAPIPGGVTDDLFTCLSVVSQGKRFVFEPRAQARVRLPSRTPIHELNRRKRIVARSLSGIWGFRSLLNPLRYGFYSIGLFVNKLLRRLVPLCLIVVFVTSALLSANGPFFNTLFLFQCACYVTALYFPVGTRLGFGFNLFRKVSSLAFYFLVGNLGTLLGLLSFLRGTPVVKWDPMKMD